MRVSSPVPRPAPALVPLLFLLPLLAPHAALSQTNCEPLSPTMNLSWTFPDPATIAFTLTATDVPADGYLAAGLSGDANQTNMVGGDVAVVRFPPSKDNKARAKDYFLESRGACNSVSRIGACPDTRFLGSNNITFAGSRNPDTGEATATVTRKVRGAEGDMFDKDVPLDGVTQLIWARGVLREGSVLPAQHGNGDRGGVALDLTREPVDNCAGGGLQPTATPGPGGARCEADFGGEVVEFGACFDVGLDMKAYWTFLADADPPAIDFLFQRPNSAANYIGLGFTTNGAMTPNAAVIAYLDSSAAPVAKDFFLAQRSSPGVTVQNTQNLTAMDASFDQSSGLLSARFTRPLEVPGQPDFPVLEEGMDVEAIIAVGASTGSDELQRHTDRAPVTINLRADAAAPTPTATPSGTPGPAKECDVEFGGAMVEFESCADLDLDMEMFWSFVEASGRSSIDVLVRRPDSAANYIGLGFTNDGQMVPNAAVIAYRDTDGNPVAADYFLQARSSAGVNVDERQNLSSIVADFDEATGMLSARFTRPLQVPGEPDFPVLSADAEVRTILAVGAASGTPRLEQHSDRTDAMVNLATGGVLGRGTRLGPYFTAHAVLMAIAWLLLIPAGILVARYMKYWDPLWFNVHRGVQSGAVAVFLIAWIMGLARGSRSSRAHLVLGTAAVVLGVLQIPIALIRPAKVDQMGEPTKKRFAWFLVHSNFGRFALLFAVINVFIGIGLPRTGGPSANSHWYVGVGVYISLVIVFVICMEVYRFLEKRQRPMVSFEEDQRVTAPLESEPVE